MHIKKYLQKLKKGNTPLVIMTVALLIGVSVTVILLQNRQNFLGKAANEKTLEPETGVLSGNITVVSDTGASGGKYIKFGTNPTPTVSPTPTSTVPTSKPTPTPPPPPTIALKPISWWENRWLASASYDYSHDLPLSQSSDSWDYYNLAYGIDDATALFRATGKTTYLDRALLYTTNMISKAKVSSSLGSQAYRDSYMGWISNKNGMTGQEVPLYETYAWRYVSTMLRAMKENPTVYNNATYKSKYNTILAFTEKNMFDKWYSRGVNDNIYRSVTHIASHWALIATNLSVMTTDATRLARLNKILDDINYHLPNYGNASLHGQMITSPVNSAAYFWSGTWGSKARPGQDVSHGNAVMAYIVEAHRLGKGGWTDADIAKFVVTFDKVIWKTNGGPYPAYVDGTGTDNGWFIDGFMKLGRYSAAVQKRLETHTVARSDGNGALNAKLLGVPY